MTATGCTWSPTAQEHPTLQNPISDPARFPWHEVTKVAHYYLSVNALKHPMEVRETEPRYDAEANP